ncbi:MULTISPECIES: YcxB family protein [unclassified Spirillospora]|uniref:YcxB family protein n=1 Tax=unclassified Spirillospora TaxID=2642701 RepID=UPI0037165720
MDITIRYEPSTDEVARALRLGLKRQLRVVYLVVLPTVLVAAGLVCFLIGDVFIGVGMLVAAAAAPIAAIAATRAIRRLAARQLTYLCVPTTLHVTDDGYETRTDQYTVKMTWSMFSRVETTPEFWLFFINRQIAAFLPKNAFDGEQQAELGGFFAAWENAKAA